jgi:hypothetical protein
MENNQEILTNKDTNNGEDSINWWTTKDKKDDNTDDWSDIMTA